MKADEATIENAVTKHEVRGRNASLADGYNTNETCEVSAVVNLEMECFMSTTGCMATGKGVKGFVGESPEDKALIYG